MKKLFLFAVAGFLSMHQLNAQLTYNWVDSLQSVGTSQGYCTTMGVNGCVFSAGLFSNTVDFDPSVGVFPLTHLGGASDMYISNITGTNSFGWVKQITGTGEETPKRMIFDASSNSLYIIGYFTGMADFDPSGTVHNLTSLGLEDIFIAKYDGSGNYQWAFSLGNGGTDQGNGICFDGSGNIVVCGLFSGNVDFDPSLGKAPLFSAGGTDAFFARYSTAGVLMSTWKSIGGAMDESASNVTVSPAGSIIICGYFGQSPCDFDPNTGVVSHTATINASDPTRPDGYTAQYTSTGTYTWVRPYGTGDIESGVDVTTDASNNVYMVGTLGSLGPGTPSSDFNPGILTRILYNNGPTGTSDILMVKYTSTGSLGFAENCDGPTGDDVATGVCLDGAGYMYVCGYFTGDGTSTPFDFDCTTAGTAYPIPLTSPGGFDIFVARYHTSGSFNSCDAMGGPTNDKPRGMCLNVPSQELFITGSFTGTADFDPSATTITISSTGAANAHLAKYSYASLPPIAPPDGGGKNVVGQSATRIGVAQESGFSFYPNPTSGALFIDNLSANSIVEIYSLDGKRLGSWLAPTDQLTIDLSEFTNGIYLLRVTQTDGSIKTEKIVVQQ